MTEIHSKPKTKKNKKKKKKTNKQTKYLPKPKAERNTSKTQK